MKKSFLNFFIAFIVVCAGLQAQNISGLVTDSDDGEPLSGVNILVEDKNQGAVSDFDGNFIKEFRTIKSAADSVKTNPANIQRCIDKKGYSSHQHYWFRKKNK